MSEGKVRAGYVPVRAAAKDVGVSPATVYRWARSMRVEHATVNRRLVVSLEAVRIYAGDKS